MPLMAVVGFFVVACQGDVPLPKPRAYPKIDFPARGMQVYDRSDCPFTFEYPKYAAILTDSVNREDPMHNPCWFDVYIPNFDCRLYCSYIEIGAGKSLDELKADAFELADWHNKKANYIEEIPIARGEDIRGLAFAMEGPAATPFQFFITDERKHFFRGALYFNTTINPDSLAPLYDFVRSDLTQLIETFEWKK